MTYAPATLLATRTYLKPKTGLSDNALGITPDSRHRGGYHCGKDRVISDDYSTRTKRDKNGLTEAASALDVGNFTRLRALSIWLVAQCRANAADARDIREIIYSPDGQTVYRWDRERGVTSAPKADDGDDSHRWHTHISWYRDSEMRDKVGLFKRFFDAVPPAPKPKPTAPPWPGRSFTYVNGRMTKGEDVRRWQKRMRERGWRIAVDGEYGPESRRIAEAFQTQKRLTVDGIVGPKTWAAAWTAPITS